MNKKIILTIIAIFLVIVCIFIYNSIDKYYERFERLAQDNNFTQQLKKLIPNNIKSFIKEIISEKIVNYDEFQFKNNELQLKTLGEVKLQFKTFTSPFLKLAGLRSYISYYNQNLFLTTGTGILMYTSFDTLKEKNIVFKKIDNNFEDIAGKDYVEWAKSLVKNLFIKNNKVYLSYVKKIKENCFTNAVLVANLNLENIVFKEFFDTKECQPFYDGQTGGNLSDYKNDKILMSIGDHHSYEDPRQANNNPQNLNSLIGKIISIDENTGKYEILSMGHRNSQGLYYDAKDNIIFSTDHGPQGGDEININTSPDGEIKNYGWGFSSYGEHYGYPERDNSKLYKIAPLKKSHSEYGFVEPIKYFTPSIAPTQIIKTEKFIKIPGKTILYIGTLGWHVEEGDLSVHQLILNEALNVEEHNIMPVNERVRDMIYIEELNKIFLFLESSGSIGILELNN
ncbi:MAG: Soluble aldose sugar dehydrogenase YliI [Alphaproteobacteria bacterium MarineAlpha5_Bin9]|nr:MAG: Soluble aldose sugar dehydrogenase YliI [Alphaproteobacteria bacterium MarineAlpha5_Bin9]|tara:strand:- start:9473 stop:10831 length:1359 start_codon:yes stop_codon:yes gene_type:complete